MALSLGSSTAIHGGSLSSSHEHGKGASKFGSFQPLDRPSIFSAPLRRSAVKPLNAEPKRNKSIVPAAATVVAPEVGEKVEVEVEDYEKLYIELENASPLEIMDKALAKFGNDIAIAFRYIKYAPSNQGFSLTPYMQKFQHPYMQYDSILPQLGQMPGTQTFLNYRSQVMSSFCAVGLNQASRDAVYLQWPTQSMMYAQSYGQLRHAIFQGVSKGLGDNGLVCSFPCKRGE